MNPYIWCVVGGTVGYLAGLMMKSVGQTALIENLLVGVFGAFIGGDLIVSQLNGGVVNDKVFAFRSLLFAIAGAVTLVLALKLMRDLVGPMRSGKKKGRDAR